MTEADERAVAAGVKAQEILESVAPHFNALRDGAMAFWAQSSSGQVDLREKLFITVSTINSVEAALQQVVTNAMFAQQTAAAFDEDVEARNALAFQGLMRP